MVADQADNLYVLDADTWVRKIDQEPTPVFMGYPVYKVFASGTNVAMQNALLVRIVDGLGDCRHDCLATDTSKAFKHR